MSRRLPLLALLPALALGLAACASTQERSARLKREGTEQLSSEKGLVVHERSHAVRVLATAVIHDANGAAVVVALRNRAARPLGRVPVAIDVRDPRGKSVYRNDVAGLDPSLVQATGVPARGELLWVDDQIAASKDVKAVHAVVGQERGAPPRELPRIDVQPPRLATDSATGIEAIGRVTNRSKVDQRRLVVFVVARRGGKVVAAGRAIVNRLPAGKHATYHVFFIGDPRRAELAVAAPPTVLE